MKLWIKRSLFGFAGAALVAGSLAGCAARGHHGWSEGDVASFREKMVERVGSKLDLDAAQKAKLAVLADKLQAQRAAMRSAGGSGEPRSQLKALFAGAKLDQAAAKNLVDGKTAAVRDGSAEVIAAAADFFDHLNPDQQQRVRNFMDGSRWGRHRG